MWLKSPVKMWHLISSYALKNHLERWWAFFFSKMTQNCCVVKSHVYVFWSDPALVKANNRFHPVWSADIVLTLNTAIAEYYSSSYMKRVTLIKHPLWQVVIKTLTCDDCKNNKQTVLCFEDPHFVDASIHSDLWDNASCRPQCCQKK